MSMLSRKALWPCLIGSRSVGLFMSTSSSTGHRDVRVRFAPSPTGFLHLGSLRTALYNLLFARANGGKFLLRIEDTDQSRLVPGAAENLNEILKWAGIIPDESPFVGGDCGPYYQSQRLQKYEEKLQDLFKSGHAYRCFCTEKRLDLLRRDAARNRQVPKYDNRCRSFTPEEVLQKLEEKRPYVVRFKLEPNSNPFEDIIYGPIYYDVAQHEGDPIIMKTDGFPTYHFANVVDDHLMEISHVLRGVEWQASTPKHLLMYRAFGWEPPRYGHLPLIMNSDGTKLSKRQGDCHVEFFKNAGYFPEAVVNFVTRMGGGFGKTEELTLMTFEEILSKFSFNYINTNSGRMDRLVLDDLNKMALQRRLAKPSQAQKMVATIRDLLRNKHNIRMEDPEFNDIDDRYIEGVLNMYKDRLTVLEDITNEKFLYLWFPPKENEKLVAESDIPSESLSEAIGFFRKLTDSEFKHDTIDAFLRGYVRDRSVKTAKLMRFFRLAISGLVEGPPVSEMLESLGRNGAIRRLEYSKRVIESSKT